MEARHAAPHSTSLNWLRTGTRRKMRLAALRSEQDRKNREAMGLGNSCPMKIPPSGRLPRTTEFVIIRGIRGCFFFDTDSTDSTKKSTVKARHFHWLWRAAGSWKLLII